MKTKWNRPELLAASAFMATGFGALWVARDYPVGTVTRMGPGFIPIAISVLLILSAAVVAVQCRSLPESARSCRPRAPRARSGGSRHDSR